MKKYVILMLALSVVLHWYVKTAVKSLVAPAKKATTALGALGTKPALVVPVKRTAQAQRNRALLGRHVPRKAVVPK
ncbi:hypothetical protein H0X48_01130 [Candidatus Dependentiae bacterium]|nr:hypothetical protein [Candidatus Dependentiae bacterium]